MGRDPATIAVTATIALSYPELGSPDSAMTEYLVGSTEEIVAALHGYEQMGVSHLMFQCYQHNETALAWLAEAVQEYRRVGKSNAWELQRGGYAHITRDVQSAGQAPGLVIGRG